MSDQTGRGTDASSSAASTTHNPFSGLWDRASSTAHDLSDKLHSGAKTAVDAADRTYHDPKVQAGIHEAGAAAQRMGRGAATQAEGEVRETADAAQRGDVRAVAGHVLGGPHLIVGKIVATQVVNEGMRHLSPEAQRTVQSSSVGRVVVNAAEHGHIPLSPTDVVRTVAGNAREGLLTGGRESIINALPTGRPATPASTQATERVIPVRATGTDRPASAAPSSFLDLHQAPSWLPKAQAPIMTKQ